jgi:hypothetical protein
MILHQLCDGTVDQVGLHKDHVDIALRSNAPKFVYQSSGDAQAPVPL